MGERPDSRALGAYVEKRIRESWPNICRALGGRSLPFPGRRSIYDAAVELHNTLIGIDVKSKDLDERRYADGGICSVDNLLRFMVHRKAILIVVEIGYRVEKGQVNVQYERAAPIHCLPSDIYRIENLGTGQVRLNYAVDDAQIEWSRTASEFFKVFSELSMTHYKKVATVATQRRGKIQRFVDSGFSAY